MEEIIKRNGDSLINQKQKNASKGLFELNPTNDKCLELLPNGLLKYNPDNIEFSEEIASGIIELIREGDTILEIIKKTGVSITTIFNWRDVTHADYNENFTKEYDVAHQESADTLEWLSLQTAIDKSGDLYPDINKDGIETLRPNSANVQRSRLQVESLDKITENRNPYKYGNNVEPEYGNEDTDQKVIIKHVWLDIVKENG